MSLACVASPVRQELFKQSTTRLRYIADRILASAYDMLHKPAALAERTLLQPRGMMTELCEHILAYHISLSLSLSLPIYVYIHTIYVHIYMYIYKQICLHVITAGMERHSAPLLHSLHSPKPWVLWLPAPFEDPWYPTTLHKAPGQQPLPSQAVGCHG